ncbi:hypothetical protein PHMEG_00027746 [Phytophthora megakarya]|uniref:Uncharacterized protein n=1 Tax=Phytophthora megakarya TaxID=4795 RepID=A0A225V956_9STRA|nr:hypothetical protein PHMEG_00027746 [Phytophthora megakarya]
MNGRTTVDYVGSPTVNVVQGSTVNGFRVSVFLAASATGKKLPPFVVFTGVPGGPVSQEISNPEFGASTVEHTVQKMHTVMLRCGNPQLTVGADLRESQECCTQVEFVPPGVTGMDVSVMKAFKNQVTNAYLQYHINHPFPANSHAIPAKVIVNGFIKAGLIPIGPRDNSNRFLVPQMSASDVPLVCDE